jgi:hypothetical protein
MEKICKRCKEPKPLQDFYAHPQTKDNLCIYCKACYSLYYKANKPKLLVNRREAWLKRAYNLSLEEQKAMFVEQDGCCAICETPIFYDKKFGKRINTDHNHTTGKVRGLLCTRCNTFVGMLEIPSLLFKARMYLQEADGTTFSN